MSFKLCGANSNDKLFERSGPGRKGTRLLYGSYLKEKMLLLTLVSSNGLLLIYNLSIRILKTLRGGSVMKSVHSEIGIWEGWLLA
jgi:hypothetical protein